jgi:hypothetical protein
MDIYIFWGSPSPRMDCLDSHDNWGVYIIDKHSMVEMTMFGGLHATALVLDHHPDKEHLDGKWVLCTFDQNLSIAFTDTQEYIPITEVPKLVIADRLKA